MKNKTAVDWLIEKLTSKPISELTDEEWFGIMGEAKELERQQIIIAWNDGLYGSLRKGEDNAEQYYNEIYRGNQ